MNLKKKDVYINNDNDPLEDDESKCFFSFLKNALIFHRFKPHLIELTTPIS